MLSFNIAVLLGLLACIGNSSSYKPTSLKVRAVTYNVGETEPKDIRQLFGMDLPENERPDVLLISLQEVIMSAVNTVLSFIAKSDPWTKEIQPMLENEGYKKVDRRLMIGLLTSVYIKIRHSSYLKDVRHMKIPTAVGGNLGTKGGIVTRFSLYGREFTMIGAHLPAHDQYFEDRIAAMNTILAGIEKWDGKLESEIMFWLGDLNFRLSDAAGLTWDTIIGMINANQMDKLLIKDELLEARAAQRAFNGWQEQKITFKPTFKLVNNCDDYSKKRRPAWTDRIFYKSAGSLITPISYKSLMQYDQSDHKPVVGEFLVTV